MLQFLTALEVCALDQIRYDLSSPWLKTFLEIKHRHIDSMASLHASPHWCIDQQISQPWDHRQYLREETAGFQSRKSIWHGERGAAALQYRRFFYKIFGETHLFLHKVIKCWWGEASAPGLASKSTLSWQMKKMISATTWEAHFPSSWLLTIARFLFVLLILVYHKVIFQYLLIV